MSHIIANANAFAYSVRIDQPNCLSAKLLQEERKMPNLPEKGDEYLEAQDRTENGYRASLQRK